MKMEKTEINQWRCATNLAADYNLIILKLDWPWPLTDNLPLVCRAFLREENSMLPIFGKKARCLPLNERTDQTEQNLDKF